MIEQTQVSAGLISRTDIGSEGTRLGLVTNGLELLRREGADFIVLCGGFVDNRALKLTLKQEQALLKAELEERGLPVTEIRARIAEYPEKFIAKQVKRILKALPELKKPDTAETISINILTSRFYDGDFGQQIAMRLAELRDDIRYSGDHSSESFHLRKIDKWMGVCVPQKAPWRGEFYSTPASKEVRDMFRMRSTELADFYVVGCTGSSIFKPDGGESERTFFTVPNLSKIKDVTTSENQIGVKLLTVANGGKLHVSAKTFTKKDLITDERKSIRIPAELSPEQRQIVELVINRGKQSESSVAESLGITKAEARKHIQALTKTKLFSNRMSFDPTARRLDFTPRYLQNDLPFPVLDVAGCTKETVIAFGCMHAGHPRLNHWMMAEDAARILLATNASGMVGVGDFVQGLAHNLMLRDEVIGGMNETRQEVFAGFLVAQAILGVFYAKMDSALAAHPEALQPQRDEALLKSLISDSLIYFWYMAGNHCGWTTWAGIEPLVTFRAKGIDFVLEGMQKFLESRNAYVGGYLHELVQSRFLLGNTFTLPKTGLRAYMCHPSMGRTKTISIRPQEVLGRVAARNAHVVFIANFHVGMTVEEWKPKIGQRVAMQVGTLVGGTEFEDSKIKDVDQHFGVLTVWAKQGKIMVVEPSYRGPARPEDAFSNEKILLDLMEKYRKPIPPLPASDGNEPKKS